jgi:iron(III) transport system ATP-binding protein
MAQATGENQELDRAVDRDHSDAQMAVNGLVKRYGDLVAVNGLDFGVQEGELVSLLGPSGCGKSTTLRCIAGLEKVTEGTVRLGDKAVSSSEEDIHLPPADRHLGMVFQSFALWPNKTVLNNVKFGLQENDNIDMTDEEMEERAREYLALVDLDGYEDNNPRQLSGGEQQRVALARALVYDPEMLLLDEPLSNLDAKLRKEARIWLKQIQEETGVTTLYVTHDQAEASALSDRMIILNDGQIEQVGTPKEVFERPKNRFVADFLGKENFLTGAFETRDGHPTIQLDSGQFLEVRGSESIPESQEATVAISPEEINLLHDDAPAESGNIIRGTITDKLYYGDKTELVVDANGQEIIVVVIETVDEEEGDEATLHLPTEKCAVIAD